MSLCCILHSHSCQHLLPHAMQANEILHHKLTLNGYLAEFTGQGMEQITMDTDRDFFMSAQEAVEYGLIDAVVSKPTMLQVA
jgi:ATP-dependent Clp protease protease subunit